MKIPLEHIIELVTREVIKELVKRGYAVDYNKQYRSDIPFHPDKNPDKEGPTSVELCMKDFKTPLLTEMRFEEIGLSVKELVLPEKTVITPGAWDQIKKRNIKLNYKS